ncbi:glycosyltransferase family 2 protein [Sulfurimonas sp.]|uniref:glycosyltransferase n=1 Tax=Sulfurimonas sp. TaxID=2022749 RepID=UPI00356188FD
MENLRFSIIVPTYNEEHDIRGTLESLISLTYDNKEIIIVDDSNDNTPNIVREYVDKGVRLIIPKERKGRCEARNIGIRESSGDILVILNADVLIATDFLEKIKVHYDEGTDIVCVNSSVKNIDDLFARYVECVHRLETSDNKYVQSQLWTEGYSVKRDVALKTNLFPSGFSVPIVAGEDAYFGQALADIGAKKIVDMSIRVEHIAPASFKEYWYIRKGRGAGTPQIRRFLDKWSYRQIAIRAYLKIIRRILMMSILFPMLHFNYKVAKFSPNNRLIDTVLFSYSWIVEQLAMSVGEIQSLRKIIKEENKTND